MSELAADTLSETLPIMILSVFVCCFGNAQKLNYGAEAGYLYNWLSVEEYNASGRNGFKIGGLVEFTLKNNISFESGVTFVRKGGETWGKNLLSMEVSRVKFCSMDYIQIPLNAGYKFSFNHGFSVKPQIGLYYAVGVAGHSFVTGIDPYGQPYEARTSTFSGHLRPPYRPCNRSDWGLSAALELAYRHVGLKVDYDYALTNATYYGNGKHRTLSVTAIYWIR